MLERSQTARFDLSAYMETPTTTDVAGPSTRPSVADVWKRLNRGKSTAGFEKLWNQLHNDELRSAKVKARRAQTLQPPRGPLGEPAEFKRDLESQDVRIDGAGGDPGSQARALERCAQQLLDPDVRSRRAALQFIRVRRRGLHHAVD
jgi:hypothetical protein